MAGQLNNTSTQTDAQILRFASEAQRERAQKRRGPSAGTTQPFAIGQKVRDSRRQRRTGARLPTQAGRTTHWWTKPTGGGGRRTLST
jgi:hypothetical protein